MSTVYFPLARRDQNAAVLVLYCFIESCDLHVSESAVIVSFLESASNFRSSSSPVSVGVLSTERHNAELWKTFPFSISRTEISFCSECYSELVRDNSDFS